MRTHFPGALYKVRSAACFPFSVVGVPGWVRSSSQFLKEGARLVNRSKVPVQTHPSWGPDECELVAESAEPTDPAPELPAVRPDGQGVQLRERVQERRPGCRDQGPPCLDDGFAGGVARRLWP